MKLGTVLAGMALVSTLAVASPEVAPKLVNLNVTSVESRGAILQQDHRHPFTNFLISIPVEVSTGSVCTTFVGQEDVKSTSPKTKIGLQAKGSVNPMTQACIEIFPMPIKTQFTYNFQVLTGGFIAANPIQQRVIEISGAGDYLIILDMNNETVKLHPVK